VNISFASRKLERLYEEEVGALNFPREVMDNFFYHVQSVSAAQSEADLLMLQSLPLIIQGSHYLLRLGSEWNLSLSIQNTMGAQTVLVDMFHALERSSI
jgi:plasmid maintenance system killer protein